MNKFSILVISSLFATGAFAAAHTGGSAAMPEAQKQGSPKAQAAAEDRHNAKSHGTNKSAMQPEAQNSGNAKAKASAARKHKSKTHTGKKNSTDAQQTRDEKKL